MYARLTSIIRHILTTLRSKQLAKSCIGVLLKLWSWLKNRLAKTCRVKKSSLKMLKECDSESASRNGMETISMEENGKRTVIRVCASKAPEAPILPMTTRDGLLSVNNDVEIASPSRPYHLSQDSRACSTSYVIPTTQSAPFHTLLNSRQSRSEQDLQHTLPQGLSLRNRSSVSVVSHFSTRTTSRASHRSNHSLVSSIRRHRGISSRVGDPRLASPNPSQTTIALVIPPPDLVLTPNISSVSLHDTYDDDVGPLPIHIIDDTSVDGDSSQPRDLIHGSMASPTSTLQPSGSLETQDLTTAVLENDVDGQQEGGYIRRQAQPAGRLAAPPVGCADDPLQGSFHIFATDTAYIEWARYNQTPKIKQTPTECTLPGLVFNWSRTPEDLNGWTPCVHPEGSLYFYHHAYRAYTPVNLFDHEILKVTTHFVTNIHVMMSAETLPNNVQCMIKVERAPEEEEPGWDCYYYLVHHEDRSIFWLTDYLDSNMLAEIEGVDDPRHIKYAIEMSYWKHIEMFPEFQDISDKMLDKAMGILIHAGYDSFSSTTSTAPYSAQDLQQQLVFIKDLRNLDNEGGYKACVVGRLMSTFAHEQFLNFAGQLHARLSSDQAVYDTPHHQRSWLITVLSPILFFAPDVHLKGLETLWVDQKISQLPWKNFINKIEEEWKEFILYSTVSLAANTALLAVPTVDDHFTSSRTPVQILSYVSTLSSAGSIIAGLLLERQYRTKARDTANDAAAHLARNESKSRGLETLAILYSLPYAGLMWAMVTFLAALSCLFFMKTTLPVRLWTGIPEAIILFFILACIWFAWSEEEEWWVKNVFKLIKDVWENATKGMKALPELVPRSIRSTEQKVKPGRSTPASHMAKTPISGSRTSLSV